MLKEIRVPDNMCDQREVAREMREAGWKYVGHKEETTIIMIFEKEDPTPPGEETYPLIAARVKAEVPPSDEVKRASAIAEAADNALERLGQKNCSASSRPLGVDACGNVTVQGPTAREIMRKKEGDQ